MFKFTGIEPWFMATLDQSEPESFRDAVQLIEYVRLRHLGYLSYRALLAAGLVSFLLTAFFISALPFGPFRTILMAILTVFALVLAFAGGVIFHFQRVTVYRKGGLYIAKDQDTGLVRHGETPSRALDNITDATEANETRAV